MSAERTQPWMMTHSGKRYYPTNPRPEDVDIKDVAHHLSMLCRYTGACNFFYSVAEHSILVANLVAQVAPEHALAGLLHDATEAYLGDMGRPLKSSMPLYRKIEDLNWELAIAPRFGLPEKLPQIVHDADEAVYRVEAPLLMHAKFPYKPYVPAFDTSNSRILGLAPASAKRRFLDRYEELTRK